MSVTYDQDLVDRHRKILTRAEAELKAMTTLCDYLRYDAASDPETFRKVRDYQDQATAKVNRAKEGFIAMISEQLDRRV